MTLTRSTICSPRWATSPDPTLRTIGGDVARTALILGQPLIPWQRHAANVFGTLRDDGRFRYRRTVLIVPRRAGKTWLDLCYLLTVARRLSMSRGFYAQHRRETGAALWRDEWFPRVEVSPLFPRYVRLRQSNGSEAITFKHNRSTVRLMPPDGNAMRSLASNQAVVDEAREFTLEQGAEFERAVFPTQATGRGGQFHIRSNAGTGESGWLRKWRDIGRVSTMDPSSEIACIEYAAPDDADPADPATWLDAHPGLGYHVDIEALAADAVSLPPDDFAAEYLGLWPETQVDSELVAGWLAGTVEQASLGDPVMFGVELSIDRSRLVVVAAGTGSSTFRPAVAVVLDTPMIPGWVDLFADQVTAWRPVTVGFDAGGPVGGLKHELVDLPINLVEMGTREIAAASGAFHDRTLPGGVEHGDDPVLVDAVTAARRRDAGGSWLWDRRAVTALPMLAATIAVWRWSDGRSRPPTVS